uniref:Uncharacterized protein n=1 Tax=Clonostachys rogersoniana TaxID=122658 RepID=A0A8F1Y4G9_CLORO|nr:hypothetical protein [Clonostachys rogersoniana]
MNKIKLFLNQFFTRANLYKVLVIFIIGILSRYLINNYLAISYLLYSSALAGPIILIYEYLISFNLSIIPLENLGSGLKVYIKEFFYWMLSRILGKKAYILNMNPNPGNNRSNFYTWVNDKTPASSNKGSDSNQKMLSEINKPYEYKYVEDKKYIKEPLKPSDVLIEESVYREMKIPNNKGIEGPSYILGVKYSQDFYPGNFESVYVIGGATNPWYYQLLWKNREYGERYEDFMKKFNPYDGIGAVLAAETNEELPKEIINLMYGYGLNPIPDNMSTKEKCKYFSQIPFTESGLNIVNRPNGVQDLIFKKKEI